MIGLEKIVGRIEADGRNECDEILANAHLQAETVRRDYERQAQRIRLETETALSAELSQRKKSRRDLMRMDQRQTILKAKQRLVEETFLGAQQALSALNNERKEKLYVTLAAAAKLDGRKGELILSPGDRAAVGNAVVKKTAELELSTETRPIEGLILRYGTLEVDCTFETILEQLRRTLSAEIAALLFGPEGQGGENGGG